MPGPLVETKLFIPRPRRTLVARPRLSERLSRGAQARLTLVSAPAGFGKTTLLAQWLAGDPGRDRRFVAWLSLDESDGQPASFWTYVITALQTVVPGVGASALPLLQSAEPPVETVLTTVLNELGSWGPARPDVNPATHHETDAGTDPETDPEIFLVLDDYHLVDGPQVQAGMEFLLDHLPPLVHVVISTRADPALPLARLRARGDLVEVRAADLRFTPGEVTTYLNEVVGLELAATDIAALEGRTEGWIAALQLAALSMQGRPDAAGFIAGFAGDDRYIVDYLVEEVLSRQPDEVRGFLLRTSILDRLSGPLCDAVTAQPGGKATLEALDRANLFVVRLDDSRRWYRYHHLFADVLRTHLGDELPGEVFDLHRRASQWYAENGEPSAAVRHALAAGDVERAAELVELAIPELRRTRQETTIRRWLDDLPADVVRGRPVLAVGLVGGLMQRGEFDGVEERLHDIERWLEDPTAVGMVVVDEDELPRLPGAIQLYRTALSLARGDVDATLRHAQLTMERAAVDDAVTRAGASALSGLALWGTGDLEGAHAAYSATVDGLRGAGHISDVLGCSITLADLRLTQGRLRDAERTYEDALRLAADQAGPVLRGTADMHVGLSQVALERNDLDSAIEHLRVSQDLGEHLGLPQNPYRSRVASARIREAQGDLDAALELLDEARRVYTGDFSPNVRPIPAQRARMLAAHGRVDEALAWVREQGLSVDDDLSYLREYEHLTLARVLLAGYAARRAARPTSTTAAGGPEDVEPFLARLLRAAEEGRRGGSLLEVLVLQALARHARGDTAGALPPLGRALTLAEPEGFVRLFAAEGPPMAALLGLVARQSGSGTYVRRLLAASGGGPRDVAPTRQALVDPLSARELEVLRLLASDLDGPAIARELVVSLNTLRTHTKKIYAKLGVTSRRAAVRSATDLHLI